MNDKEIKPHIDRLKKDPSLSEILNFTEAIIKKLPEDTKENVTENNIPAVKNQLNADTLNSLVKSAQSFVNPTTLSLLSRALNQSEIKDENPESPNLRLEIEHLSAELSEVKEELNQIKIQLAEQSQRFEDLETNVQILNAGGDGE
ncbi:hypothetical protein [Mesobacillus boroniphilus]|nr:hypothetical protein [Mesobacillus boroniphilus]